MHATIQKLVGKTIVDIAGDKNSEELVFTTDKGEIFKMFHKQDCCESVTIEDICGDLKDLLGSPILMAEETTSWDNPKDSCDESFKWTFYKLATIKGYVTIRWYGTSNGNYSESVDITKEIKGE